MNLLIAAGCCVGIILLILPIIIFFVKFKITILVNNKNIKVYLWKIKVFDSFENKNHKNTEEKNIDKEDDFEKKYKGFKHTINFVRKILDDKNDDLLYIIRYVKKTFAVKSLDISLDYGFGDAAVTGVTGGIVWGLISNICGFVSRFIDINSFTNIAVKPHYTEKILDYKVNFVFYIRILNLLKTYKRIKRFKKTLEGRD